MARSRSATKQEVAQDASLLVGGQRDATFQRAILKIALELKKPGAQSYDAVVDDTVGKMRIDAEAFRHYLGANRAEGMGLLLAASRKFGP
jgi:hypothetical protein